jgi:hypothetical protein
MHFSGLQYGPFPQLSFCLKIPFGHLPVVFSPHVRRAFPSIMIIGSFSGFLNPWSPAFWVALQSCPSAFFSLTSTKERLQKRLLRSGFFAGDSIMTVLQYLLHLIMSIRTAQALLWFIFGWKANKSCYFLPPNMSAFQHNICVGYPAPNPRTKGIQHYWRALERFTSAHLRTA